MKIINKVFVSRTSDITSFNSDSMPLEYLNLYAIRAAWTNEAPTAKTFDSGVAEVNTITCPAASAITSGQYFTIFSALDAIAYYVWFNKDAAGGDPAPAGKTAVAVAIAAANTAGQVATAVAAALDALAAFVAPAPGAAIITCTNASTGVTTDAANVNVGAGFTTTVATQGVTTEITLATDQIAIPTHGYVTGLLGRLTTTNALPTGLATGTDYFVINVSASVIKLASSLANAVAGTAVDITGDGTGVHTFTATAVAGTVKLQSSLDPVATADASSSWEDVASSSTNITATGSVQWEKADVAYTKVRLAFTVTAGQITSSARINAKGHSTGG